MIEIALYDYLTCQRDLTANADTESFVNPITIGNFTILNRNDARRYLRSRIGKRIYAGRSLENEGQAAVTVRRIGGSPEYHLKGDDRTTAVIQIDAFTKGPNSFIEATVIGELIRIAISSYDGTWGKQSPITICTVEQERSSLNETAPRDSSPYWTHRLSADYSIFYLSNLVEV